MMRKLLYLLPVLMTFAAFSQDIQINRQNKTIAVTADESVTAEAEVAVLSIGYHNYGASQDAAFHENVRAAERITKAILDAKIPEANIETEKLGLGRAEADEKWTEDMKKERRFQAQQSWHVTVSVLQAQTIVDLCVNAGANEVEDVEWNVADPMALQAKAAAQRCPRPGLLRIKWRKDSVRNSANLCTRAIGRPLRRCGAEWHCRLRLR